jgi:hypothetical protein
MPDRTKADISRENGAKSRGPVTPEGKRTSSMNALKHGLTAKTVCLANESQTGFQNLADDTTAQWQPVNEVETQLVEEMVVAKWTQRRYWGAATATIDTEMAMQAPAFERKYGAAHEPVRIADALAALHAKDNHMALLLRYNTALGNQFHRAQNQLIKIREKNIFPEPPASPEPDIQNERDFRTEPSPEPNPNIPNDEPAAPIEKKERWLADGNTTYVRETPKTGRNELCPCGSGVKFKKCCLDKEVKPAA